MSMMSVLKLQGYSTVFYKQSKRDLGLPMKPFLVLLDYATRGTGRYEIKICHLSVWVAIISEPRAQIFFQILVVGCLGPYALIFFFLNLKQIRFLIVHFFSVFINTGPLIMLMVAKISKCYSYLKLLLNFSILFVVLMYWCSTVEVLKFWVSGF